MRTVTWNSATWPSFKRPRISTTSNQSMLRTVLAASATADFTASAKLTDDVPTISIFLYVPDILGSPPSDRGSLSGGWHKDRPAREGEGPSPLVPCHNGANCHGPMLRLR